MHIPYLGDFGILGGVVIFLAGLSATIAVGSSLFVLFIFIFDWSRDNKKSKCRVKFDWEEPCVVGEPVRFRILLDKNRPTPPHSAEFIEQFMRDAYVEIRQVLTNYSVHSSKVEYAKEYNATTGEIIVTFSVRTSGLYIITVSYKGVRAVGGPFRKRFKPSNMDASKTLFLRPSPTIVCVANEVQSLEIQPKDKYGNDCDDSIWRNSAQDMHKRLKFEEVKNGRNTTYCYENISHVFIAKQNGSRIEMIINVRNPGVYRGQILYDDKTLTNGQFDILCVTYAENKRMLEIAHNSPAWVSHQVSVLAVGDELQQKLQRKAYIYVSPKMLYVKEYILKIIPMKIANYRVSPMTKITFLKSFGEDECEDRFSIYDGIQPKLVLQAPASQARVMMALYFYFLKMKLGGSENFEGKQRLFYQELKGSMTDLRITPKLISVSRSNLVHSSVSATKFFRKSDWFKNFGIKFQDENGYDYGGLRREWLELLCVQFFQDNQFGMFSSFGTSRLVHPNPSTSRYALWTLKHYSFAGRIVGKCLIESAFGDAFAQMVKAKFTRSFLAQILGLLPNYQHFEQDDPELYVSKIKYILENDVGDMELTFSEEEYDSKGKLKLIVDLIPNGSKKLVTPENRIQYLNALANYKLGTKVSQEIEAFKQGLHELVPEEFFSNFDENELELLMCGRSEFSIEDLKDNMVKEYMWGAIPNKLYSWFCTAVANMNDDERGRLLQFVTGSSLLPHGGFKALSPKFKLSITGDHGKLPKAHTCFNTICLSNHDSYEQFERALRYAITEGAEGFAFT